MTTRTTRRLHAALLLALAPLALAACTREDDGDGVSSLGTETASEAAESAGDDPMAVAVAYSECMRDNGIEDYPDPVWGEDGGISSGLEGSGVDQDTQEFTDAHDACFPILEAGMGPGSEAYEETREQLVAYAECMRDNGIAEFPDPEEQAGGGFAVGGVPKEVQNSDEYAAAEEACAEFLPNLRGDDE
ncbi:hypothetical protein [Glycomyces paridis]|uniref:Uncharacterized protein n=1 Tax=Glycomyces paridis TaxID=2126555 RepID=A0A4S8PK40_9ACTN|nr:hypothetical protein [Glycomyces paridis]THV29962.1 hypothetical protein E9998_06100 [Glycomyces paridis]